MKIDTNKLPWVGVSHNPSIKKKVFIPNGVIPKLTTFGTAVFEPGQFVEKHIHQTMYEVFYITKGKAIFNIEGVDQLVQKKDCVVIEAGKKHSQNNPFEKPVEWIYFGIATD